MTLELDGSRAEGAQRGRLDAGGRMIRTKRWNDPAEPADGFRILVCRFRPRGVPRERETWEAWLPQLGPSVALHAAVYGKAGAPIAWEEYARRYLEEMESQTFWIRGFGERFAAGEALTLLCSSACVDPARCHRTLLKRLIEESAQPAKEAPRPAIRRRPPRGGNGASGAGGEGGAGA